MDPQLIKSVLLPAWSVIDNVFIAVFGYYLAYSVVGVFLPDKKHKPQVDNKMLFNKFALVIYTHNQSDALTKTLTDLEAIEYPEDYIKIYVVADNCTSADLENIKKAISVKPKKYEIIVRSNTKFLGRAYAMSYAQLYIGKNNPDVTALTVINIGDILHSQYFMQMDKYIRSGYDVLQGQVNVDEPFASFENFSRHTAQVAHNRIYNNTRAWLGMSVMLEDSGYTITTNSLDKIGWDMTNYSDSIEYSAKCFALGQKITYAANAGLLTSIPSGIVSGVASKKLSLRSIHLIYQKYSARLFKTLLKGNAKNKINALDYILYLSSPLRVLVQTYLGAITLFLALNHDSADLNTSYNIPLSYRVTLVIVGFLFYILALLPKINPAKLLMLPAQFAYYRLTTYLGVWLALANKNNKNWRKVNPN
jgi:hypothetical protein